MEKTEVDSGDRLKDVGTIGIGDGNTGEGTLVQKKDNEEISPEDSSSVSVSALSSLLAPPTYVLTELTSLDELSFPTSSSRRMKYTCISVSPRYLVLGTSTGTVYVFSRFASKLRTKLAPLPVNVFTTKDGPVNTLLISPSESHVAVGSESGRISVAGLNSSNSPTKSPTPAIVYTVPGDIRRSERVTSLAWSLNSETVFVGFTSGKVCAHKINVRSVFRTAFDQICAIEGEIVQLESTVGRLLVSSNTTSFVVDLETKDVTQIGKKPRSDPMGACFMGKGEDAIVLAARPNGRLWEANQAGTVYRTHQLRLSPTLPFFPTLSSRYPFTYPSDVDVSLLKGKIGFTHLTKITVDSRDFVLSIYDSHWIVVVDLESSPSSIVLVSDLQQGVSDVAVCGSDIFVLFSGYGGLKKFTVFSVDKSIEKLIFKEAFAQAAEVSIQLKEMHGYTMGREIAEQIDTGLRNTKSKDMEPVRERFSNRFLDGPPVVSCSSDGISSPSTVTHSPVHPSSSKPPPSPRLTRKGLREPTTQALRLSTGIHRVVADRLENSGYEDDFTFQVSSQLRERSKSSSCIEKTSAVSSVSPLVKRQSLPITCEEMEECSREGTPSGDGGMMETAKRLLESTSLPETDSLRTLLGMDPGMSVEGVQFTPTVTWSNAPRTLAHLATTVPLDITEKMRVEHRVVKRTPVRSSEGVRRGARVIKTVRPLRPVIRPSNPPMTRVMEVRTSPIPPDPINETNSKSSTKTSSVRGGSSSSLLNSPLIEDDRMSGKERRSTAESKENLVSSPPSSTSSTIRSTSRSISKSSVHSPLPNSGNANVEGIGEKQRHRCTMCGVHRSWMAVSLFGPMVRRIVVAEGMYTSGGVPSSWPQWQSILSDHLICAIPPLARSTLRSSPCTRCKKTMDSAKEILSSSPLSTRSAQPLRVEREKIRQKAFGFEDDVIEKILMGSAVGNVEENGMEVEADVLMPTPAVALPTKLQWIYAVDFEVLLLLCAFSLGVSSVCTLLQDPSSLNLRSLLSTDHWSLLTQMKSVQTMRKQTGGQISNTRLRSMSDEFNLGEYFSFEAETATSEKTRRFSVPVNRLTPPPSSINWMTDLSRGCPICTLPLRSIVGGIDGGAVSYPCGHTFHSVCIRLDSPSSPHSLTPPSSCVACRMRIKARMVAAQARK